MQTKTDVLRTLGLEDHCTVLAALRRSLCLNHYRLIRCSGSDHRSYWLTQIREAYSLYRRLSFGDVNEGDRYCELTRFINAEHV